MSLAWQSDQLAEGAENSVKALPPALA